MNKWHLQPVLSIGKLTTNRAQKKYLTNGAIQVIWIGSLTLLALFFLRGCVKHIYLQIGTIRFIGPRHGGSFAPDSSRSQLAVDTFFCPSSRTWSGKQWQLSMESRCQLCFDQLKNCCTNCGVFIGCICCRCIADTITLIEQLCSCTQLNTKRLFFFGQTAQLGVLLNWLKFHELLQFLACSKHNTQEAYLKSVTKVKYSWFLMI